MELNALGMVMRLVMSGGEDVTAVSMGCACDWLQECSIDLSAILVTVECIPVIDVPARSQSLQFTSNLLLLLLLL